MTDSTGDAPSQPQDDQPSTGVRCSNCGTQNETGDRFCANCGTPLPAAEAAPTLPPQFERPAPPEAETADGNWRMSSLGPPPPRRRRVWLWVLLALLGLCVLVCVGIVIFASTGSGQEWLNDFGTRVAEQATEQAR